MLRWQRLLITVAMGQFLSLLITGTGITTQYLSRDHNFNFPTFQSTLNYILLAIFGSVLTFMEFRRQKHREPQGKIDDFVTHKRYETEVWHRCQDVVVDDGASVVESVSDGFGRIPSSSDSKHFTCPYQLKRKWWHYLLVALADVEGNYLVVKAYKYTNITSIMLLDCFSIPSVMCISFFILKTMYRRFHMAGVCLCLGGLGALVYSDYLQQQSHPIGDDPVIGDILCVCGAVLYTVSNVGQEMIVNDLLPQFLFVHRVEKRGYNQATADWPTTWTVTL